MLLIIVQDSEIQIAELARLTRFCENRFKTDATLASVEKRDDAIVWPSEVDFQPDITVYLKKKDDVAYKVGLPVLFASEIYEIDTAANQQRYHLKEINGGVDYDKFETHIFNRISRRKPKGYMYLPYGYTYRMTGHGQIDEFGFRIDVDLAELKNRPKEHIVVATFGGSTTWSIDCLPEETYTSVLENLLNSDPFLQEKNIKVTCLNFGQVAYSVISEMMTYLLFAADIKPDIVIAHDGWNDLLYGSYVDPYLLKDRKIVYPCDLEPWAQLLHDGMAEETTKTTKVPFPLRSSPSQNLDAFFFRKSQFKKIVEADGAMFVWGLQPCLLDKENRQDAEEYLLDSDNPINQDDWRIVRKKIPVLLREIATAAQDKMDHFVDVGAEFKNLNAAIQHFTDTIHLTAYGDGEVASVYHKFIVKKLMEQL